MRIITELKEGNELLQLFAGAFMQIVAYTDSLKRIVIRLSVKNSDEVVYLVGIGCESINGQFYHSSVKLSIEIRVDNETSDEITTIFDKSAPFELVTSGGFAIAKGQQVEFGEPFYDFLSKGK